MNFLRMFIIVVGVTLCGGAFGGVVGGLLGFAAPNSLEGFFGMEMYHGDPPPDARTVEPQPVDAEKLIHTRRARFGVGDPQRASFAASGAAVGAASGLVLGALLGIGLAVLDQLLVTWRGWLATRFGAAGEPSGNLPPR